MITTDEDCAIAKAAINRLHAEIMGRARSHPDTLTELDSSVMHALYERAEEVTEYERIKQVKQYPPYMPWLWWGEGIA